MAVHIGILSDTHGLLRQEVLEELKSCDYIFHAGDINSPEILDQLREIAPLFVVRGNNDKEWAEHLPHHLHASIGGLSFFMVHNKKELPSDLEDTDVVIFGHSHKYVQEHKNGRLWLNPGSCGKRRFDQEITFAVMTVRDGQYQVKKCVVPQEIKEEKGKKERKETNMLEAGTKAPQFELFNQEGELVRLSDFLGQKVALYFYSKDNTAGCTRQARGFADAYEAFRKRNVVIIGISKDSAVSHQKFVAKYNLPFLLLSDPELQAIQEYGVWQEKRVYGKVGMGVVRSAYLIDEKGMIEHVMSKVKPDTNAAELLTYLDEKEGKNND
jgi:putative phosphoesterase